MNHLPFETQIIEHHHLDESQQNAFNTHLIECNQCRNLFVKWQMVENHLQSVSMVNPSPGFRHRWQAGLSHRRAQEQHHQVYHFLLVLLGVNLVSLAILIGSIMATGSATQWLFSTTKYISYTLKFFGQIREVIHAILQLLPPFVPVIFIALSACGLCMAIALWVFSLWRISFIGVNEK